MPAREQGCCFRLQPSSTVVDMQRLNTHAMSSELRESSMSCLRLRIYYAVYSLLLQIAMQVW